MKTFLTFLTLFPLLVAGQFIDDFSDGDFSDNPPWQGDTEKFIVNGDLQLQLSDDEESSAFLAVPQQRADSTEWFFNATLQFSPSGNNNARIYLMADAANPTLVNNAVFLQLGESGSDDALSLVFKNGSEETEICRGTDGLISSSFSMNIKVTHRHSGIWRIYFDPLNNGNYILDAEGTRQINFDPSFFIVQCTYTVSNSEGFVFDDFMVRPFQLDLQPPEVEELELISDHEIEIRFSEPVSENSATDPANYLLDNESHPTEVVFDDLMNDRVNLLFDLFFQNNSEHLLSISGISDIQGNVLSDYDTNFTYLVPYYPEVGDVVVNELMADVNPEPASLPPYDYLELYNTTDKMLNMSLSTISWGSHHLEIPEGILIEPHGYLLLADDNADYGEDVDVVFFSSLPLNTETLLVLKNSGQEVMHALDYKKEWYHNPEKEDGGWSLEMIDPTNRCGGIHNYRATENDNGGTPGEVNSVFGVNPDTITPGIHSIAFESDTSLKISFDEPMDSLSVVNPQNYQLFPEEITPASVTAFPPFYQETVIFFSQNVYQENTLYTLEAYGLLDCSGNELAQSEVDFSTYQATFGDIVITEVMADVNPAPRGLAAVEYVELYNHAAFPLDLSGWHLFVNDDEETFAEGTTIQADEYLVIAGDQMPEVDPGKQVVVQGLSIPNDGCEVYVTNKNQKLIHYLDYERALVNDPLKQEGGWSAEKIDYQNTCGTENNWEASIATNGGTPGATNSVAGINPDQLSPDVLRVAALSVNSIRVYFDELMDMESLNNPANYSVSPELSVAEIRPVSPAHRAVDIIFDQEMNEETTYRLELNGTPRDCAGNGLLLSEEVYFTLPIIADSSALIINEILFNTSDENEDFLEVYNTSDYGIDLSSVFISLKDPFTGELKKKVVVSDERIILLKKGLIVFTRDAAQLLNYYPNAPKRNVLEVDGLSDFPSKEGLVVLQTISNQSVDSINYHEGMQFGLLNNFQNVSIERIGTHVSSDIESNWHSAAESHGFATPGELNSQTLQGSESSILVELSPKIITPDNDGRQDVLMISIKPEKPGYSANITVFDAKGREVIRLANNYLLGVENALFWDGATSNHRVVSSGYYIIYLEIFDLDGGIQHFKKTVVVTSDGD